MLVNKKRLVLMSVVLVMIVVALIGVRSYQSSFGVLRVSSDDSFELRLFALDKTGQRKESNNEAVRTISSPGNYKLKKGEYSYKISGGLEYEPQEGQLTLDGVDDIKVELPLTPQQLAEIKEKEQSKVVAALNQKYPTQMRDYVFSEGRVFGRGGWYFGVLTPKAPEKQDALVVILQNKNGSWEVVTDPPNIVISKSVYPNIPEEVFNYISSRFTGEE
jgi:hypothetical protein